MERHFQYVAKKVMYDNNSDYFAAHLDKLLHKKTIPKQCREIVSFKILSTINPISLMKTWGK